MPAPVVIDVGVVEPQRELAAALVAACAQAAAGTDCHLVRDAPNGPYTAVAIVTWEEGGKARVEVGLRRDPVSEWRTRELTFQAADAEIERYRSVGFVIGSLATAAHDDTATPRAMLPEPPPPPPPKPVPVPPPSATPAPAPPAPRPSPSHGWVGLVGMMGGGLDQGPPRFGGRLGAGIRVIEPLSVVVSAGASTRERDAHGMVPQWLDAGCGLNFSIWPPAGSHLELRGEVLAEQFSAEAEVEDESGSLMRTTAATRFGIDGVLVVSGPFAVVAGVEATLRSATIVHVRGESAGSTRNFELGLVAGVRLDL